MSVAVESHGDALFLDDMSEHQQVSVSVLLVAEEGEGDGACGIVYGSDEGKVRTTALEPVVLAAIDLQAFPPGDNAPASCDAYTHNRRTKTHLLTLSGIKGLRHQSIRLIIMS